ncbi:MAG: hypothetical protein GPJ54_08625 [Candidatus Heimdallarchaeota archaeon]|nr:hypothetical protein [Candidatus Heimdallarchaeota archaeon]
MRLASSILMLITLLMLINPVALIGEQSKLNSNENEGSQLSLNNVKIISYEIVNDQHQEPSNQELNRNILTPNSINDNEFDDIPSNSISFETAGINIITPIISLQETDPPTFGTPPATNITYEEGSTLNSIKWKVDDANPDMYVVYANSSFLNSNTWTKGFVFTNVDGLSLGTWNITVVFNDTFGNILVGEKYAFVVDTTIPTFVIPSDLTYTEATTGNFLEWNATDFNPDNYEIFRDGLSVDTGSWDNPSNITISVDGLQTGIYTYTINVYDIFGNMAVDSATVTVVDDPNIPSFTLVPSNTTISELSIGNVLTWNA